MQVNQRILALPVALTRLPGNARLGARLQGVSRFPVGKKIVQLGKVVGNLFRFRHIQIYLSAVETQEEASYCSFSCSRRLCASSGEERRPSRTRNQTSPVSSLPC